MSPDRQLKLLNNFYDSCEVILKSDLPHQLKMEHIKVLYSTYCTAVDKTQKTRINYETYYNWIG